MNISIRLKELRTSINMSQAELAEALGISPAAVGMYESGSRLPKYEILEKIADYFNVSIDYLRGVESRTVRLLDTEHLELMQRYDSRPQLRRLIAAAEKLSDDDLERITKMTEALVPEE